MNTDLRLWNAVYKGVVGALVAVGLVCIAAGSAVALYAGWVVYLLIEDPKRIALVSRLVDLRDRKSTRLNSSHGYISYAVFCLKKKKNIKFSIPANGVATGTSHPTTCPRTSRVAMTAQ